MIETDLPEIGEWQQAPAYAERPIFAIGDVHGCFDALESVVASIRRIVREDSLSNALIIGLGDYIDRGPYPLAVLRYMLNGTLVDGAETVVLPGNHEAMMMQTIEDEENRWHLVQLWLQNGGYSVSEELDIPVNKSMREPDMLVHAIRDHLGDELLSRLSALPTSYRHLDYLFVHAGLHPAISMRQMLKKDWKKVPPENERDAHPLWIAGPFMTHDGNFDDFSIVVHGHIARKHPEIRQNRIGLDTGAGKGGGLTCAEFRGDKVRFIRTPAIHID